MRLVIASDVFPPLRSSGAVQLRDLTTALAEAGHEVTMLVATPGLATGWQLDALGPVHVLRLRAPRTKDVGHVRRAIGELLMPFWMIRNLRRSPLARATWDGVVWYSPTIFLGPLVRFLKHRCRSRSYLILRDIFPEWAVDMGLMGRGLAYRIFKAVARYQYGSADVIGIQTEGNSAYFPHWSRVGARRLEVLQNWLALPAHTRCSIDIGGTALAGRTIFVYAGNMGIAQGMGVLLGLGHALVHRDDIGFVFVGRGSDATRLREEAVRLELKNVVFFDEIDPDEIPALYAQCHVGLVALDVRHKSHNIPGKFLSYLQSGLPVLASINPGNDLEKLIVAQGVGCVDTTGSPERLAELALDMARQRSSDPSLADRCRALWASQYSPAAAAAQVVRGLEAS